MSTIDDKIAAKLRHLDELKRARRQSVQFERTVPLDEDIRRQIIVGGLVQDVFPQVLQFTPQSTDAENEAEFAPFKTVLGLAFSNGDRLNWLLKKMKKYTSDTTV